MRYRKNLKIILCAPCYMLVVLLASIFSLVFSLMHIITEQVYFNPIELKWVHFDGTEYLWNVGEDDLSMMLFSPFLLAMLIVSVTFCVLGWKIVLVVALSITVICLIVKAAKYFIKETFKKEVKDESR